MLWLYVVGFIVLSCILMRISMQGAKKEDKDERDL
jgi:uncharacterized BrkB/YihY/UPF0761 family membrane protein